MIDLIRTGVWANCEELKHYRIMGEVNKRHPPKSQAAYMMRIKVDDIYMTPLDVEQAANLLALKHGLPAIEDRQYTLSHEGEFMIEAEAWEKFKGGDQNELTEGQKVTEAAMTK